MKYALVIFLLLYVPALYAQEIHVGPKVDVTIQQVNGKGISNGTTGLQAGLFFQWVVDKHFSVQPELFYMLRNLKKDDDFMTYYVNSGRKDGITKMQLNYVCLPILARYDINDKFAVMAGPQVNYLFFANENLLLSDKKAFKRIETGLSVGGQFNLSRAGFSLRYNPGLSNINNIDDRYQWKTGSVQIGISVKL